MSVTAVILEFKGCSQAEIFNLPHKTRAVGEGEGKSCSEFTFQRGSNLPPEKNNICEREKEKAKEYDEVTLPGMC